MANENVLFKAKKGLSSRLSEEQITDGQLLFTTDDAKLYIDSKSGEGKVDRSLINPNPDWEAEEGTNAYIRNKPTYVSDVSVDGEFLVVRTSDSRQKSFTVVEVEEYEGDYGTYVRLGSVCHYILNQAITIDIMTSRQSKKLEDIPAELAPSFKINSIVVTSNAQLTDSLLLVIDPETETIMLTNRSSDILYDVTLLPSSYTFVVSNYYKVVNEGVHIRAASNREVNTLFDESIDSNTIVESPNRVNDADIQDLFDEDNSLNNLENEEDSVSDEDINSLFDDLGDSSSNETSIEGSENENS